MEGSTITDEEGLHMSESICLSLHRQREREKTKLTMITEFKTEVIVKSTNSVYCNPFLNNALALAKVISGIININPDDDIEVIISEVESRIEQTTPQESA